jgi:S1-C subfamily serine protease
VKILLLLVLAACGGGQARLDRPPDEEMIEGPKARPPRRPDGLTRAELVRTLDAGPGAFLGAVHVRAATGPRGFVGWEIVALDAPYSGGALAPGDVVTRVNGHGIERPEQLSDVFAALRTAPAIVVEYLHAGEPRELTIPVVE